MECKSENKRIATLLACDRAKNMDRDCIPQLYDVVARTSDTCHGAPRIKNTRTTTEWILNQFLLHDCDVYQMKEEWDGVEFPFSFKAMVDASLLDLSLNPDHYFQDQDVSTDE